MALDVFTTVSWPVRRRYTERLCDQKTIAAGLEARLAMIGGEWPRVFLEVAASLRSQALRQRIFTSVPLDMRATTAMIAYSFTVNAISELAIREVPEALLPPHTFAALLSPDNTVALQWRQAFVEQWRTLLHAEDQATQPGSPYSAILQDVHFAHMGLVRLAYCVLERDVRDNPDAVGDEALALGKAVAHRLHDEKAGEDTFGHMRDLGRANRTKSNVRLSAAYHSMQASGVLQSRELVVPAVDRQRIATCAWDLRSGQAGQGRMGYPNMPKGWPSEFDACFSPKRVWPSPMTEGNMEAYIAWQLLQAPGALDIVARVGTGVPHWPRLLRRHDLVRFETAEGVETRLVLYSGHWGCMCMVLESFPDEKLMLPVEGGCGALPCIFTIDPADCRVYEADAQWTDRGVAITLKEAPGQNLLQTALLRRHEFSMTELEGLVKTHRLERSPKATKLDLTAAVVRHAFGSEATDTLDRLLAEILEAYTKDPPPKEDSADVDDPALDELLGDLIEDMEMNAQDLKAFRGDIRKRSAAKLGRKREAARAKKASERLVARAKSLAKRGARRKLGKLAFGAAAKLQTEPTLQGAPPEGAHATHGGMPAEDTGETANIAPCVGRVRKPHVESPPAAKGGWDVVEVPGGWLRVHSVSGRIDAHCAYHKGTPRCKLDRMAKAGNLGLSLAWLDGADVRTGKHAHDLDKWLLSQEAAYEKRRQLREQFEAEASQHPGYAAVLQIEKDARGGDTSEPLCLACHMSPENVALALLQEAEDQQPSA